MSIYELLDELEQYYSFGRDAPDVFGACSIYRGHAKTAAQQPVTLYVPQENTSSVTDEFNRYEAGVTASSLPTVFEFVEVSKGHGALVLRDRTAGKFLERERELQGRSWMDGDAIPYAPRQSAALSYLKGVRNLGAMGLALPQFGVVSNQFVPSDTGIEVVNDRLYFGGGKEAANLSLEWAFAAPETLGGEAPSKDGPDRVHALGRLLIYLMLGPTKFAEVLGAPEVSTPEALEALLHDNDFWSNRADRGMAVDKTELRRAAENEMPPEVAEVIVVGTDPDPKKRYPSIEAFSKALVTAITGKDPEWSDGTTAPPPPKKKNPRAWLNVAATLSVLAMLSFGGWWYLEDQENRRLEAELLEAATASFAVCDPMKALLRRLEKSPVSSSNGWATVTELRSQLPLGQGTGDHLDAAEKCPVITQAAIAARLETLETAQQSLRNEASLANERSVQVSVEARRLLDIDVSSLDVDEAPFIRSVNEAKDGLVVAVFQTAEKSATKVLDVATVLRTSAADPLSKAKPLLDALEKSRTAEPSASTVRALVDALDDAKRETFELAKSAVDAARVELSSRVEDLKREMGATDEVAELTTKVAAVELSGSAIDANRLATTFDTLAELEAKLSALIEQSQIDMAALDTAREAMTQLAMSASTEGWSATPEWEPIAERLTDLATVSSARPSWEALSEEAKITASGLSAEWREGSAVCTALGRALERRNAPFGELSLEEARAIADKGSLDDGPAQREEFAACENSLEQLHIADLGAAGAAALDRARVLLETAQADGKIELVPGYDDTLAIFKELTSREQVTSEEALESLEDDVQIFAEDITAIVERLRLQTEKSDELRELISSTNEKIGRTALAALPQYNELMASFDSPSDNPFDAVPVLLEQSTVLSQLYSDFINGEIYDCSSEVLSLSIASISIGEDIKIGCVSKELVSTSDLQTWHAELTARDQALKAEIQASLLASGDGPARNISGFLARAYIRYLNAESDEEFCLPPKEWMESYRDQAKEATSFELTGTVCEGSSERRTFLSALDASGSGQCLDSQIRFSELGFRVSKGADVCAVPGSE